MSWIQEWHAMLHNKAVTSLHSYPADFRTDIYDALRSYCTRIEVVYFPAMYDEYLSWNAHYGHLYRTIDGSFSPVPNDSHLRYFTNQSALIQEQIRERTIIRDLEKFAKKEKIVFHDDSIIEKISLAAHYAGLRGGG